MRKVTRKDAITLFNFFAQVKQLSDLPKDDENSVLLSPDMLFCTAVHLGDLEEKVKEIQKIAQERISPEFTAYQEKRIAIINEHSKKDAEGQLVDDNGQVLPPGIAVLSEEGKALIDAIDEESKDLVEENIKVSEEFEEFLLKEIEISEETFSRTDLRDCKGLDIPVDLAKVLISTGVLTK